MIASPCIKVCALDRERLVCLGCGRTLDEIARWSEMTDEERARVIALLPARRAALATPAPETPLLRAPEDAPGATDAALAGQRPA